MKSLARSGTEFSERLLAMLTLRVAALARTNRRAGSDRPNFLRTDRSFCLTVWVRPGAHVWHRTQDPPLALPREFDSLLRANTQIAPPR